MYSNLIIDLMQIIMLTVTTVVVMLTVAVKRDHGLISGLTVFGLFASLLTFVFIKPVLPLEATQLLIIDEYSLFFSNLIIAGAIAVALLAYPYFEKDKEQNEEFYILLMTATLGAVVLACSNHFVAFLLGVEMLGVSLYAMIAYSVHMEKSAKFPLEAGIKYLILSALTGAVTLFGIALVYAYIGTMEFDAIPAALEAAGDLGPVFVIGVLMIVAGAAFKLSLVPFHIWTPDVYEGAPVPVTAYLATVSKAAMLAVTLRLLLASNALEFNVVIVVLTVMAAASMIFGNLLALLQDNVKRLFAYSSIAHMGYLLVMIIAASQIDGALSVEGVSFYMLAYFIMSLAGFAVISAISNSEKEYDQISDFRGLFWRNSWLSIVLITVLLSLAGIPLTAGFIGKFYIFTSGVEGGLWFLLTMLIIGSAIGLYYYLRLIYIMLQPAEDLANDPAANAIPLGVNVVLTAMTAGVIYLGVFPAPMIDTLQSLASAF
ncbi:MAG: NADH-quinone oxidoreductase subunit N [Gammaproteobacteria bacterium]|jgi:NADH-quinone oxidoreductase subunit N|nr:NADH-quinone oxidoreductase subunit N [Gammaproteobacteria bacterium]